MYKRQGAYSAQVHKGLYDHEYSETENGVTATYIVNIYRGDIKKITTNYGDDTLNKTVKYFYDEKGNNTAIIEENSKDREHTICITYTYDSDGNVTYICDQKTKYTMSYNDGEMTSLMAVSYTHLDVYKRQVMRRTTDRTAYIFENCAVVTSLYRFQKFMIFPFVIL